MSAALGPHQKGIHDQTGRLLVHGGMDDSAIAIDFVFSLRHLSNSVPSVNPIFDLVKLIPVEKFLVDLAI